MAKIKVSTLAPEERIDRAKQKMEKLVDHTLHLINVHEANRIIIYSPTLTEQIPLSRAAHAFRLFQDSFFRFEMIRLCVLWDKCSEDDLEKESIPAVIQLIDAAAVLDLLQETICSEIDQFAQGAGKREGQKARKKIESAIHWAKRLQNTSRMEAIRNHRDKHIAHSLEKTRLENRKPISNPRYGDEKCLLWKTIKIMDALYHGLNRTGFDWSGSIEIARRNAAFLWNGCKFEVIG